MRETLQWVEGSRVRKKIRKGNQKLDRARGKYYTNQLHSAEIIDELSSLLVIN